MDFFFNFIRSDQLTAQQHFSYSNPNCYFRFVCHFLYLFLVHKQFFECSNGTNIIKGRFLWFTMEASNIQLKSKLYASVYLNSDLKWPFETVGGLHFKLPQISLNLTHYTHNNNIWDTQLHSRLRVNIRKGLRPQFTVATKVVLYILGYIWPWIFSHIHP